MIKLKLITSVLVFFFGLLLFNAILYANPEKNFNILDSLFDEQSKRIANILKNDNIDSLYLTISEHPAALFIKQSLTEQFNKNKLNIIYADNFNSPNLNIIINSSDVAYKLIMDNNDSLIREISVNLSGTYQNANGSVIVIESHTNKYVDIVSREDIDFVKSFYNFANAPLPPVKRSFFDEITQPLIVVTSAIIVIVLLFTVRSG